MDVLLLSSLGRIGIVETKLAYNPERRREVVAQILEYALNMSDNEDKILEKYPIPDLDGVPIVDSEEVRNHFRDTDFLLIVAGDEIDPRAVKLSQSLAGDHMITAWDLATIDVSLFQATDRIYFRNSC